MALNVRVAVEKRLKLGWSRDEVFALIADVPRSAAHFPGLRRLDDLGDGVYRWNLDSFRLKHFSFSVSYAARYVSDKDAGTVRWTTVEQGGNTRADGRWELDSDGDGPVYLRFINTIQLKLAVPRLISRLARPMVEELSHRQVDTYLRQIAKTMDGRLC